MRLAIMMGMVGVLTFSGCTGVSGTTVSAELHHVTNDGVDAPTVGWANFTQEGGKLTIRVVVTGLSAGEHGVHIHQNGGCGPTQAEGTVTPGGAAGAHFNPTNAKHGQHAGDLGNVNVQSDGHGTLTLVRDDLTLTADRTMTITGRTVVVHAKADDLATDPSGNSGARLLCGLIPST